MQRGTREWSAKSFNILLTGCSHACRYCYAKANALRWGKIASEADWADERPKTGRLVYPRNTEGWVMFPTTHDITPRWLDAAVAVVAAIRGLLSNANRVLIVSKPHLECMRRICEEFQGHRQAVLFRFTIGALDESLANFWEPGAPSIPERLECLRFAFNDTFRTSVSIEPMLSGCEETVRAVNFLDPYVSETIWIGKMNQVLRRVRPTDDAARQACREIQARQSDSEIMRLVKLLSSNPKVCWKDSIQEVMGRAAGGIAKPAEVLS